MIDFCYLFDGVFLYVFRMSIVAVLFVVQTSEEALVVGRGVPLMQESNVCVVQERVKDWLITRQTRTRGGVSLLFFAGKVVIALMCCALLAITSLYDIRHRIVPPRCLAILAVLWFIYVGALVLSDGAACALFYGAYGVASGVSIAFALLLFSLAYEQVRKRESLGGGDIKLLAVLALYLGFEGALLCLFAACMIMLICMVGKKVLTKRVSGCMPFAPFLCVAAVLVFAVNLELA